MFKNLSKTAGFSLIEILLSGMIFIIAAAGIIATMSKTRTHESTRDVSVDAAVLGKQFLENLQSQVDSNAYTSGNLTIGNHTSNQGTYNYVYTVSCADASSPCTAARRVDLNIVWADPT